MIDDEDKKDLAERVQAITTLVQKAVADYETLKLDLKNNSYIGTQSFEERFQTIRLNIPLRKGLLEAGLALQKEYPFSLMMFATGTMRSAWKQTLPEIAEDIFSKNDILTCRTPTEIHRSLANLRGLDLIIVNSTPLSKIEIHDIFSIYKPKLIVLLGDCDG